MRNDFYVYLHRRKTDGIVFYVGKGKEERAFDLSERSNYWKRIVKKYGRTVEFVATGIQEWYAFELEKDLIALYGRRDIGFGTLCNMTDGGDGGAGIVMSESAKAKVRAAQMGNTTWKGRKHTEETKQKMRKPKSEEAKANMRKPKSEEMKRKLSETKKKPVVCSNGMHFDCLQNAAKWIQETKNPKAAASAISLCCLGKLNNAYGFRWEYI